jgi:hypothetical protein
VTKLSTALAITALLAASPAGAQFAPASLPLAASSGSVAASVASATMPAVLNKTNYLTGLVITGSGATGASVVVCTITGASATLSFDVAVPAGVTTGIAPLVIPFEFPVAASAQNTAITASCPSFGVGNANAAVSINGYVQ